MSHFGSVICGSSSPHRTHETGGPRGDTPRATIQRPCYPAANGSRNGSVPTLAARVDAFARVPLAGTSWQQELTFSGKCRELLEEALFHTPCSSHMLTGSPPAPKNNKHSICCKGEDLRSRSREIGIFKDVRFCPILNFGHFWAPPRL